jgi:AcrR family transcriptional regulator
VARTRSSDTRERIQAAARELFIARGVQQTSLRDIADRLGITKPALYYHFDSREALLHSIVEPMVADMDAFIAAREAAAPVDPRALLADYFDLLVRHGETLALLVNDLSTLAELKLNTRMFDWRRRLVALLVGDEPTLAAQVRAIVAIGGMSDCALIFPGVPRDEIKAAAVEAACAALGLPAAKAPAPRGRPAPPRPRARGRRGAS